MKRPTVLPCSVHRVETKCGKMYITIGGESSTEEVFFQLGKTGSCARAWCEAAGKLVSNNLRNKMQIKRVVKQWKGIDCHGHFHDKSSCPHAIATLLESVLPDEPE